MKRVVAALPFQWTVMDDITHFSVAPDYHSNEWRLGRLRSYEGSLQLLGANEGAGRLLSDNADQRGRRHQEQKSQLFGILVNGKRNEDNRVARPRCFGAR